MNHADPSPAYFDPTSGHSSIDLWVLLDSACCMIGSAYMSWRIVTAAHSIVATTGINAYAVVYAALVHYFDDGHGITVELLESWTWRACQGRQKGT